MMPALLTLALTLAAGQTSSQRYAGTWIAEFEGTTFVRLELTPAKESLSGRIALGDVEFNADGNVRKAKAAPARFTPIFDIVMGDASFSFARKDGNDTDRFEMRWTGQDAELVFLISEEDRKELAATGVPVLKPFRLRKISSRQ